MTIFKNKKGSTFVEAAVIMPLVILAVMSLFYILINLYENVDVKSRLHLAACAEAGYRSETYSISPVNKDDMELNWDKKQIRCSGKSKNYNGGLLKKAAAKKETGYSYIIVEEEIIRKADYVLPD